MKVGSSIFFCLALLTALAGCVPSQQQLQMERDLEEMKRRLAETERATVALRQDRTAGETRERLDALGRTLAEQQANLDATRVEVQSITGRLEDLRRERAGGREEMTLLRDDLALKITALEDRLNKAEERMNKQEERLSQQEARVTAPPVVPPPANEPPEAQYERALEAIQKGGDFARGREQLQEFLGNHPRSPLAINAMYWIGESYYGEKKYENAILQFQDIIQKYPDHPKAASALLKQALAFDAMGDRKNARIILQKLIDTFPLSEEAKKARDRLAEWDKGKKR